jgi:hypothetical protein
MLSHPKDAIFGGLLGFISNKQESDDVSVTRDRVLGLFAHCNTLLNENSHTPDAGHLENIHKDI